MKDVVFAPVFVTSAKFVQVAPWQRKIENPVSFSELSNHWSRSEFEETTLTVRLLGGLGAVTRIGFPALNS